MKKEHKIAIFAFLLGSILCQVIPLFAAYEGPGLQETMAEINCNLNGGCATMLASTPGTLAGLMTKADKAKLDGISTTTEYWSNGTQITTTMRRLFFQGVTTNGAVTFYLTNDGTAGGSAICPMAVRHVNITVNDQQNTYGVGFATSTPNKSIYIPVMVRQFTTGNALLNLLGGLVSVITGTTVASSTNGTPVMAAVDCN